MQHCAYQPDSSATTNCGAVDSEPTMKNTENIRTNKGRHEQKERKGKEKEGRYSLPLIVPLIPTKLHLLMQYSRGE